MAGIGGSGLEIRGWRDLVELRIRCDYDSEMRANQDNPAAEKLYAMLTERYFRERAARADIPRSLEILKKAGVGNPTLPGDEILRDDWGNFLFL
jgi:hypothetical protein